MALYPNGSYISQSPGRFFGGATGAVGGTGAGYKTAFCNRADRLNRFLSSNADKKESVPAGYGINAPIPARSVGGMASKNASKIVISSVGAGALGYPLAGSTSFTVDFAAADGELISSGQGTASFYVTADGNVIATLQSDGNAFFTVTAQDALMEAYGWVEGAVTATVTAQVVGRASGNMEGSTVNTSTLTPAAIAQAILDASQDTPMWVDIQKILGQQVTGSGTPENPWGP